ncbi:hypothetical protein [Streptomyces sp. Je 1-332]
MPALHLAAPNIDGVPLDDISSPVSHHSSPVSRHFIPGRPA